PLHRGRQFQPVRSFSIGRFSAASLEQPSAVLHGGGTHTQNTGHGSSKTSGRCGRHGKGSRSAHWAFERAHGTGNQSCLPDALFTRYESRQASQLLAEQRSDRIQLEMKAVGSGAVGGAARPILAPAFLWHARGLSN